MEKQQSRRRFLSSMLEAGLSIPAAWAKTKVDALTHVPKEAKRQTPVSPAGSLSHSHLNATCNGCQKCIEVCPTKVLRPCTTEYDMAGVLQPVLDFSKGYCDFECNECTKVCPTGAISPITLDQKQNVIIGRAVLVKSLCINDGKEGQICSVCAEACPCSAIKMKEDYNLAMAGEGKDRHYRKYPVIEDILCIGCGICESKCPSARAKAIHVEGLEVHKS